jgi:integrase
MWERTAGDRRVQREAGLGSVNAVPLAKAREIAVSFRTAIAEGRDPIEARQAARADRHGRKTFGDIAKDFLEANGPSWRNAKHAAQWKMTLEVYGKPLWPIPVDKIDTAAILGVLQPIWQAKPETASRLRGRIEAVLDAARVAGHIGRNEANPARWKGHLEKLLPKAKKISRGHHAAMLYADVPAFLTRLREREAMAAVALEFLILTAARTGEVLGARWDEIDLAAKLWAVPAVRMKAGREHRVPLSSRALAVLGTLAEAKTSEGLFIFPGQKQGKPLSNMALEMQLRRLGVDVTTHGFRSSFRDWCGDQTSFPRELAEAALAHVVGDRTEAAYRRGDALEKRRKLMDAWAQYLGPDAAPKVVSIARKG